MIHVAPPSLVGKRSHRRGYLSLQRLSPCHLFLKTTVALLFLSSKAGRHLRPPVLSRSLMTSESFSCSCVLSVLSNPSALQSQTSRKSRRAKFSYRWIPFC